MALTPSQERAIRKANAGSQGLVGSQYRPQPAIRPTKELGTGVTSTQRAANTSGPDNPDRYGDAYRKLRADAERGPITNDRHKQFAREAGTPWEKIKSDAQS